jgi:hypothetical protein
LLKLFEAPVGETLPEAAAQLIDDYMTEGQDDSVFLEPAFLKEANRNLNTYLKSDKVGSETTSPRYRSQLRSLLKALSLSRGKGTSSFDQIVAAIKCSH